MFELQTSLRLRRVVGTLCTTVLLGVGVAALPAAASADVSLALSSASPSSHQGVQLSAQVARASATSVTGLTVDFYVHVEEFAGAPLLEIGSGTTNTAGVATITYQPTWAGTQNFVASAFDPSGAVLATSSLSVQAARSDPFAGAVQSLRPDGLIGRWVVFVLLALVIGVWITLLALVVRVQQGPIKSAQ
ncbi:MAG: hypothetical protein HKL86_00315 [Acidimicrobiaceae bacterium]|nr:hypothetical protein [Acidimicrobiaceae bacterium]